MSFLFSFPSSITILGFEVQSVYIAGTVVVLAILCCGCCYCRCCRKKTKVIASEQFRWPSSSRFLKKTDPSNPPKLVVGKYDAMIRTDRLPEKIETFWIVKYQPNGERAEVKNNMYLTWKDGIVFGVGYEKVRQLCKISGKYNYNKASNQTVVAFTCTFSNDLDTVMFHGWGNGTSFMGNCYIKEIDRFALMANVPLIRNTTACKFKGSFLLQKMDSMGDPSLRVRLHTRRVHKWAGRLFPDDAVTPPTSPMRPDATHRRGHHGSRTRGAAHGTPKGRVRKTLSRLNPFARHRRRHFDFGVTTPTSSADGHSWEDKREIPPWVQEGAADDDEGDDSYGGSLFMGRLPTSPSRFSRRPSPTPIDTLNYLIIDGVPGRSGPSMV